MSDEPDTNAAVWKTDQGIASWMSDAARNEREHAAPRRLLAELLPFDAGEEFTFVDLGAGTGNAARAVLDCYPAARAILADFSPQMIAEGERALAPYAGRCSYVEFDLAGGDWPAGIPAEVPAVISSLCVHHLPDARKQGLFAEIFRHLAPGGWYLNFDAVSADDPAVADAWERVADRRDPGAAQRRAHRSHEDSLRWENHVRYMIPLAPQVDFLRAAGFGAVDVYWKELGYVIYGGRRPPAGGTGAGG